MEWLKWIIPLVGVAVWIISQIAAKQRDAKRPNRTAPPRAPEDSPKPAGPRPQRTTPELERFLDEVRRRQQPSSPSQPPRTREARDPPRPQPVPRPVARTPAPSRLVEPPRPLAPSRLAEPQRTRSTQIPTALPVSAAALPTQTLPVISAPPPPPTTTVTISTPRNVTHTVHLVRAMLKERHSLAAALILREVFDPPVSRRRVPRTKSA